MKERKLWTAVLYQAYKDAEYGIEGKKDAREWLCAVDPYFEKNLRIVCDMAAFQANQVIAFARNRYGLGPA